MTMKPNPGTEPSMAKLGRTVQSAFFGRNRHATRESSPTPCREAAQSNKSPEPTAVGACRSAVAVHVASRRWLSFLRSARHLCLRA
jgi:hypothetical protein